MLKLFLKFLFQKMIATKKIAIFLRFYLRKLITAMKNLLTQFFFIGNCLTFILGYVFQNIVKN